MNIPREPTVLPTATFRRSPEDFIVEELPAYAPSGAGEHLYICFRKRGLTTFDALRLLSEALGTDARAAGYAGLKDRHAVTTQTASFPFPLAKDPEPIVAKIAIPGIEILSSKRHENKLKPGHLLGNQFLITLRDLSEADLASIKGTLEALSSTGVPNAFGPQRFGRDGDNPERALAWLAGRERGPRDKRQQRLLFSSLQSLLFNRVLELRERDGSWMTVLPGDVAKKHDTGGLFDVPIEGPELEDARARAAALAISATGPIFGAKMRAAQGLPGTMEREALQSSLGGEVKDPDGLLAAFRHLGEGTRRSLRMQVTDLHVEAGAEDRATSSPDLGGNVTRSGVLTVRFVLPKGGYATTVLGRACRLSTPTSSTTPDSIAPDDPPEATEASA